jgi:hypothetical protein
MRPSAVAKTLDYLLDANQPAMLWGPPGVGKSSIVHQRARARGMDIIDLRLSQLDAVDLRGIPSVDQGTRMTHWNTPSFLPREGRGILFLDEINLAPLSVAAASYQLVLDRKLGEYELPPGWTVIAAGNRVQDRTNVQQMSTALKNRFIHVDFEVNLDDWSEWALKNGIHVSVLSFIRFRPTMLNMFDAPLKGDDAEKRRQAQAMKDQNSFATPRSWEFMSKMVEKQPDPEVEYELFCGTVGEGAAAEFMGYLKYYRDLPNLDALLMNPGKTEVPKEPATLYALSTGLAAKATEDNFDRVVQYTLRMPQEFQVLLMKDAVTRTEVLTNTKAFNEWTIKNSNVLM